MMYHYQAFQLTIFSDLFFPELLACFNPLISADVRIVYGAVPLHGLDAPLKKGLGFQTNEHMLWLNVPNVARFLVSHGQEIMIDPVPGVDEDSIRVFILGSCFGALLMQRALVVLHGNAIRIGHYSISVAGASGAGKSTLSGAFFKRGYSILADDVCVLNEHGDVLPSFPQIKLWADAAKRLNIDTTSLRKIRPTIEKYAVPLGASFHQSPLPLKVIYILNSHNKTELDVINFAGINKFQPLKNQLYRLNYLKGMAKDRDTMKQCGALANRIAVVKLARPDADFPPDKLVDFIEGDLAHRGFDCVNG